MNRVSHAALHLDPTLGDPVLSNATWNSLQGAHAHMAESVGQASRYQAEVAQFIGLADHRDPQAWRDLLELIGPGVVASIDGVGITPPPGWTVETTGVALQMVAENVTGVHDPEAITLGPADVPEMLDLIGRTKPGPFRERTIEMGRYIGFRENGVLVAMAGERVQPTGWTEISAVCTDPDYRGRGYASRLVLDVAAGITARGDRAYLHSFAGNTAAIRVYETLGFRPRVLKDVQLFTSPAG